MVTIIRLMGATPYGHLGEEFATGDMIFGQCWCHVLQ